jgi:hypothetical protein
VSQERYKNIYAYNLAKDFLRDAVMELDDGKAPFCEGSALLLAWVKGMLIAPGSCAVYVQWPRT